MSDNIGIIGGTGVVGSAIVNACERELIPTIIADEYTVLSPGNSTFDRLMECDAIFVCVPSPMIMAGPDSGKCDSSILESVLSKLGGFNGVIISKVTAPPDVYTRLGAKYKNLTYSPEFLTAANAATDYYKADFCVVSGTVKAYINEAERIIVKTQPHATTVLPANMEEASLMKYAVNSFLATKVIFMNELYELAKANNIDYNAVATLFNEDFRTGGTHVKVPSPVDNTFGFGGMCFPKDTNALLKYAEDAKIELSVLDAAVKKNTLLRLKDK
jgi:UDPglucose 6-dehydrogenase